MMDTISTIAIGTLAVLITFGLAVFVHEFGHMMFALMRGVGVESFAIGMGPRMYSWKWYGIDFSLRWLPVGGFVKLKGMIAEEEENQPEAEAKPGEPAAQADKKDEKSLADSSYDDLYALRNKGLMTKLMVFGGGVFMNYVAAIVATAILLSMPIDMPISPAKIDKVMPGSPAERAGLQPGDLIVAINDRPTTYSALVSQQIKKAFNTENKRSFQDRVVGTDEPVIPYDLKLTVQRGDKQLVMHLPGMTTDPATTPTLGVEFWQPPVVGLVHAYMPEDKAGIETGDVILAVNGQPVQSFTEINDKVSASPGKPVTVRIKRGSEELEKTFTPIESPMQPGVALVGILSQPPSTTKIPGEPILRSIVLAPVVTTLRIGELAMVQYNFFRRATLTQVKENLGGPVMIAAMTARQAKIGLKEAINWFIMLNLVLLIFNLLPLPVLDGGFLLLSFIEAAIRRPVSPKVLAPIYTVFTIFFIGLMLLITFWDVQRFISH